MKIFSIPTHTPNSSASKRILMILQPISYLFHSTVSWQNTRPPCSLPCFEQTYRRLTYLVPTTNKMFGAGCLWQAWLGFVFIFPVLSKPWPNPARNKSWQRYYWLRWPFEPFYITIPVSHSSYTHEISFCPFMKNVICNVDYFKIHSYRLLAWRQRNMLIPSGYMLKTLIINWTYSLFTVSYHISGEWLNGWLH